MHYICSRRAIGVPKVFFFSGTGFPVSRENKNEKPIHKEVTYNIRPVVEITYVNISCKFKSINAVG